MSHEEDVSNVEMGWMTFGGTTGFVIAAHEVSCQNATTRQKVQTGLWAFPLGTGLGAWIGYGASTIHPLFGIGALFVVPISLLGAGTVYMMDHLKRDKRE